MSKVVYVATRTSSVPRDDAIDGVDQINVIGPSSTTVSDVQQLVPVDATELSSLPHKLVNALWRSAAGRTLVRISPFDQSRRFWRAVRRQPRAFDVVRDADVIVAADRDAIWAAWHLARATRGPAAVYGVTAAKFALNIG